MPRRTGILDSGLYVYAPGVARDEAFDRFLELHAEARNPLAMNTTFSIENASRQLNEAYFKGSPSFMPLGFFFKKYRPLPGPFWIIWCGCDHVPHWIVRHDAPHLIRFSRDRSDRIGIQGAVFVSDERVLAEINAALREEEPFIWYWKEFKKDCYLFGEYIWELTTSEVQERNAVIRDRLIQALQKERLADEMQSVESDPSFARTQISEEVQMYVWRRDQGRCVKCGSQQRLEFDHIIPISKGGSNTARNVQILCETCNRKKSDQI